MENSSSQSDGNKPSFKVNSNSNLVAWRIKPTLMPMFQDLAKQAYEAHLINAPKLINLAKFSLSFFAEIWLQQKAAQARYERQQLQGQRAPVKDINGSLYTGSNRLRRVITEMENVSYIEDPKRLRQTVKPFKAMMENPKSNVEDAAKQVDDMTRDTAYERLYDFIAIYQNTVNNQNFPQDLLRFYSRFSQADDEEITHDEVIAASKIIVRFATLLPSNIQTCDIEIRCKDRFYCVLTVRCC